MNPYAILIDGVYTVPKGNFALLQHSRLHPSVIGQMMQAESAVFTNPSACVTGLRSAFEAFALEMEYLTRLDQGKVPEAATREAVIADLKEQCKPKKNTTQNHYKTKNDGDESCSSQNISSKEFNCKTILRDLVKFYIKNTNGPHQKYLLLFQKPAYQALNEERKIRSRFDSCFFHFYALVSDRIHNNSATIEDAVCCVNALWIFVSAFLNIQEKFRLDRVPYEQLYPVPAELYPKLRLISDRNTGIYIQDTDLGLHWFLLKTDQPDATDAEKRDLSVLEHLWEAPDTPENILRIRERLGNGKYRRRVFCFPARPYALNAALLAELSAAEKETLAGGILRAVCSLHTMSPPYAHRALTPECFYVCRIGNRIKPILACFGTVKDLTASADETVYMSVSQQLKATSKRPFLAPEIAAHKKQTDWLPADIYSAGVLLHWIATGDRMSAGKESAAAGENAELIRRMTDPNPAGRPDISMVLQEFRMHSEPGIRPAVQYAAAVEKGPRNQEDAFFCTGEAVLQKDQGTFSGARSGACIMAVFDGIGGGDGGDVLSLEAARSFQQSFADVAEEPDTGWSRQLCSAMDCADRALREKIQKENFYGAGCSAAAAVTDGENLYYVNLGDSRIYLFYDRQLKQLSVDHRFSGGRHASLYQYLGLPEEDGAAVPAQGSSSFTEGDLVLLCTDGLTDYVSDDEITAVLQKAESNPDAIKETAQELVTLARKKRSKDNITVMLCRKGR